jgi:hypothetical protein
VLFTTVDTAVFPPLLSLPDRVNAITNNGFDEVGMYGSATVANEGTPDTMKRPVPEYGNHDEQRHEKELLDERQRHRVVIADMVLGLS